MTFMKRHIYRAMKEMRSIMLNKIKRLLEHKNHFITLLVGVPSYEKYVEHMADHHPEAPVKSRKEFFCEAQEARYSGKGGKVSRCC
jgi:uncharacterized short protein YbdD (DUF466 family)